MQESKKMKMDLVWNDINFSCDVDMIEIPSTSYPWVTPYFSIKRNSIKYDKIRDTYLYLDEHFMNHNYPYLCNNSWTNFYIKNDNVNIRQWFTATWVDVPKGYSPLKGQVVANGTLKYGNAWQDIKNVIIESDDGEYFKLTADF